MCKRTLIVNMECKELFIIIEHDLHRKMLVNISDTDLHAYRMSGNCFSMAIHHDMCFCLELISRVRCAVCVWVCVHSNYVYCHQSCLCVREIGSTSAKCDCSSLECGHTSSSEPILNNPFFEIIAIVKIIVIQLTDRKLLILFPRVKPMHTSARQHRATSSFVDAFSFFARFLSLNRLFIRSFACSHIRHEYS